MFSLTVTDHVRLDSDHVARNYTVHAQAARRLVTLALGLRIAVLALLVFATAASGADLLFQARIDRIAAVVACSLALIVYVVYSMLNVEARVAAHRSFAGRLWLVSERYRALMAEVEEGMVDKSALLQRRDELIRQLHEIYEQGFGPDENGYEDSRLPLMES